MLSTIYVKINGRGPLLHATPTILKNAPYHIKVMGVAWRRGFCPLIFTHVGESIA